MRYVGYSQEEIDTVWKLLAAILQLVSMRWYYREGVSCFDDHYPS